MTRFSPYLLVPFLLVVALFQTTVLPELTVLGIKPELMLLSVLAWSLLRGVEEGLVWAFVDGFICCAALAWLYNRFAGRPS